MPTQITYRAVTDNAELADASHLEAVIWAWDVQFASPTNVMRVTALKGGLVLCAFHGEQMVGMSWALPARCDGHWVLWSHVAGVLPVYRRLGIGAGIKWAQREWALDNGYDQIRWTFDPLQAGNANFNIRLLGATASKIMENMYGVYDDALNPGLPTDRFETVWRLDDPRVERLANGEALPPAEQLSMTLLDYADGHLRVGVAGAKATARAEIPSNFTDLGRSDPVLAREWQTALRETLSDAFRRGFAVTDFVRTEGRCFYVLTHKAGR
jgi:predicted GNAT superfamily acetyltransferase